MTKNSKTLTHEILSFNVYLNVADINRKLINSRENIEI